MTWHPPLLAPADAVTTTKEVAEQVRAFRERMNVLGLLNEEDPRPFRVLRDPDDPTKLTFEYFAENKP
jgi:hypothetical protein